MKSSVLAEPILVGREHELEELMRNLDATIEGKGTTVFVTGEAGSGKTRLANEFLKRAKKRGTLVLYGWCLSNTAIPYFPFTVAFDPYFSSGLEENLSPRALGLQTEHGLPEPATIGPSGMSTWLSTPQQVEKAGRSWILTPQAWKDQAFAAVAKTLHTISAHEPVVLFIEDIHWADSGSLALLHFISRVISAERVFVLATFRSEELTADSEGHPHPLAEEMHVMRREDLFREIKLENLDREGVSKIAENMIGGSLDPELLERLAEESRGNALFVVETLRMLSERKSIVQESGRWRLAIEEVGIPSKVKSIILRRLAVLNFSQRRLLDAASVIGEKFDVELLGAVLGQASLEVLETLNLVAQSTSLVCVEENYYKFDHAKSQETLYEEIPLPLRRGYHAKVAEKLETTSESGKLPFSDLAYHYAQAGNKEKAVHYSLAAGEDALARWSNAEAIKHFTYVLQNTPDSPEWREGKRIAQESLGDAYYVNGMFAKALEAFEHLADSETGKVKLRAYRKAMDAVFFGTNEPAHLLDLVKKAEPYAASDRLESARIRFFKAASWDISIMMKTREEFEAVLQVFEEEYSLPDVARMLEALGATIKERRGLGISLRSVARFELGDLRDLMRATYWLGINFFMFGLHQEAYDCRGKAIQIGEKIGDYNGLALATLFQGADLEAEERVKEALSNTVRAAEYAKKTDATDIQGYIYAFLVRQYAKLGDTKHAEEFFEKLDSAIESDFNSWDIVRARAVFLAAESRWEEAERCFEKAFKHPTSTASRPCEMLVRMEYRWALTKQGRTEEARIQSEKIRRIREATERKFAHVDIQAHLMARRSVKVGEEFEMDLDLVNVSRKAGSLVRAEGLILSEFEVTVLPTDYYLENTNLDMKQKTLAPFQVEIIKLRLRASKPGVFTVRPQMTFVDERGQTKKRRLNAVIINVQPPPPKYEVLPNRVSTGLEELDALLSGGIPQNYAVALTSSATDDRAQPIRRFLKTGVEADQTTFHITTEAGYAKALAGDYHSNFHLIVCNPQADSMIQDALNVFKLKGVENLTDIDIALAKAFRAIDPATAGPKRICVEIISDILLQHHAVNTRRWLSALLPTLKSKGFTVLAVIDPGMHPAEETQAVLGLFDGEIAIYEKETPKGTAKFLKVKKMTGQKYLKDEVLLTEE